MPNDNQSPADIEREIETERAALSETLQDLQDRFSVEGVVQQVGSQLRNNGGQIGDSIARTARENPMALALTGIGLAWLIFGGGPSDRQIRRRLPDPRRIYGSSDDDYDDDYDYDGAVGDRDPAYLGGSYERRRYGASDSARYYGSPGAGGRAPDWARRGRDHGDEIYGDDDAYDDDDGRDLSDRAAEAREEARARLSEAGDTAGSQAERARQGAERRWENAKMAASDRSERARRRMRDMRARLSQGTEDLSAEARNRVVEARRQALIARDRAQYAARRGADRGMQFFNDQPLVAGGLALALGAALGGALPRTRIEDENMGARSDYMMAEAERVFHEEREKARKVARAASQEAQNIAQEAEAGIDENAPGDKTAADAAVDKVREAGERVAGAAQSEADRQNLGKSATGTS